jgi:hypothetical protein
MKPGNRHSLSVYGANSCRNLEFLRDKREDDLCLVRESGPFSLEKGPF